MTQDTRVAVFSSPGVKPAAGSGQRWIVLALLAAVALLDQTTKWWAWRHISGATVNPGGDFLVGPVVGSWYADPATGAFLDLFGVGFLSVAVFVLVRRRRPAAVLVPAALMIGGWGSNLLDRLGMHSGTAPGSARGAVDFIPLDQLSYNLADVAISAATLLYVLLAGYLCCRMPYRALERAASAI